MRASQIRTDWKVRVDTPVLRQKLQQSGVALDGQGGADYIFHSL